MHETHWKLRRKPFENNFDPTDYYPAEVHQGSLLKLRYCAENRREGALLCGESGTGKTLILRLLERQLSPALRPFVHLVFPQMKTPELLTFLSEELGSGTPMPDEGIDRSIRRMERFLLENAARGQHAVLAIDEAHLLDATSLEALRLLLNFTHENRPVLTLILCGQPRLLSLLERVPSLEERLSVKCLLRSFTLEETMGYVQHRMAASGCQESPFEPGALEVLHQLSGGLPRRINRMADLALLLGYAEERRVLKAEDLLAVGEELVFAPVE